MIVVDTNLLVYLYVQGQRTAEAEAVLLRDPVWAAPVLWRSEFRNVLAGLVRRRALGLEDAARIVSEAERAMAGREYGVVSERDAVRMLRLRLRVRECRAGPGRALRDGRPEAPRGFPDHGRLARGLCRVTAGSG